MLCRDDSHQAGARDLSSSPYGSRRGGESEAKLKSAAAEGEGLRSAEDATDSRSAVEVVDRLREYYKKTAPLLGYYYAKGNLQTVDGMAPMDQVAAQIAAKLPA